MGLVMVGTGAPGVLGDMTEVGSTHTGAAALQWEHLPTSHSMHVKHSMRKFREDWPWALLW